MPAYITTRNSATADAERFLYGLIGSLAIALILFEWRGSKMSWDTLSDDLPIEDEVEYPQPVVLQAKQAPAQALALKPKASIIVPGEPPLTPLDPTGPDPGPAPGPDPGPVSPMRDLSPPDTADNRPLLWNGVEQRPYMKDCLQRGRKDLDDCTEARIDAHLKRYFRIQEGLRREEFTVVTFEIDAHGAIGELVCAPRPSPAVASEIERVVRSLPEFMPGTQNGIPVPVFYQIPFRVRRL